MNPTEVGQPAKPNIEYSVASVSAQLYHIYYTVICASAKEYVNPLESCQLNATKY